MPLPSGIRYEFWQVAAALRCGAMIARRAYSAEVAASATKAGSARSTLATGPQQELVSGGPGANVAVEPRL